MPISPGTALKLLVYELDGNRWARGFCFNLQQEFDIELTPALPKIQPPCWATLIVGNMNHLDQLVPQKGSLRTAEEGEVCRVRGNQVELDAHIIFSSKTKSRDEVYSPEYGWVGFPDRFFSCYPLNKLCKAYIKRDYSPKLKQKDLLFSICSPNDVKLVDDGKKSNNYVQQLEEAENNRYNPASMAPPQPNPNKTTPEKEKPCTPAPEKEKSWNQAPPVQRPWNQTPAPQQRGAINEDYEKVKKSVADKVTLFLILRMNPTSESADKGVAWAMRLRGMGLRTTFINGQSEMLQVGCWYEGVCKWNRKFTGIFDGYYLEKVYKKIEDPMFSFYRTRYISNMKQEFVEITVEVNFTDNFFHQQPRDQNKVVLPHCQIYAIEVARILYKKYYGQKCMCRLINKPPSNNKDITDWEVVTVAKVLGPAEQEEACWSSSQAPTDMPQLDGYPKEEEESLPEGEDDGAPPDDDYDEVYYSKKRTEKPSSSRNTDPAPYRDSQLRTSPIYSAPPPPVPPHRSPVNGNNNDNTMPDDLFFKIWDIPEVRKALKMKDYDLFDETENIVDRMKDKKMRRPSNNFN